MKRLLLFGIAAFGVIVAATLASCTKEETKAAAPTAISASVKASKY